MPYKSRWSIPIPDCSLPTFLLKSANHDLSEKPCYIDSERPETHYFTRNSFRVWCQRFALGLTRSEHFKDGDRVLLFSSNTLFYPVAFMGTVMAGGIFTGANPTFTARELAYQWKDSGATYLLCIDDAIDVGIEAAKLAGKDKDRIYVFNSAVFDSTQESKEAWQGCQYWGNLIADDDKTARSFQWDELKKSGAWHKTIALNYSSGTTGFPKGVEVSQIAVLRIESKRIITYTNICNRSHTRIILPMLYNIITYPPCDQISKTERRELDGYVSYLYTTRWDKRYLLQEVSCEVFLFISCQNLTSSRCWRIFRNSKLQKSVLFHQ